MFCAFQTLEFFIQQFHILSLRERYTDSWGRLLVSTYSISVHFLCFLATCSSSIWFHTRCSPKQQSDAGETPKKLICPVSSVCVSTVHFQCRRERTRWTRKERGQPAGLIGRMLVVRQVLYRPPREIQCQRSWHQERTGADADLCGRCLEKGRLLVTAVILLIRRNRPIWAYLPGMVTKYLSVKSPYKSWFGIICEPVHTKQNVRTCVYFTKCTILQDHACSLHGPFWMI